MIAFVAVQENKTESGSVSRFFYAQIFILMG